MSVVTAGAGAGEDDHAAHGVLAWLDLNATCLDAERGSRRCGSGRGCLAIQDRLVVIAVEAPCSWVAGVSRMASSKYY